MRGMGRRDRKEMAFALASKQHHQQRGMNESSPT
jgi:hypothetical protein